LLPGAPASGSTASADVQRAVADFRGKVQGSLRARIERDISEHILPPETNAAGLAGMVMALIQGLSVLARDGGGRADLLAIIDVALAAWPCRPAGLNHLQ